MTHYEISYTSAHAGNGAFVMPQGTDKMATWPDDATAILAQQLLEYEAGWSTVLRITRTGEGTTV